MWMLAFWVLAAAEPSPPAAAKTQVSTSAKLPFSAQRDLVWTSGTTIRFSASAPMVSGAEAVTTPGGQSGFSGEATLGLAVDYFVMPRFSVGGALRASYAWSNAGYGPGFGLGVRFGYAVPFSDWVAIWPRLDLSFGATNNVLKATDAVPESQSTAWYFNTAAHLPLVFNLFQHVLLGVGPYFALEPQWVQGTSGLAAFALNFGVSSFVGWHH